MTTHKQIAAWFVSRIRAAADRLTKQEMWERIGELEHRLRQQEDAITDIQVAAHGHGQESTLVEVAGLLRCRPTLEAVAECIGSDRAYRARVTRELDNLETEAAGLRIALRSAIDQPDHPGTAAELLKVLVQQADTMRLELQLVRDILDPDRATPSAAEAAKEGGALIQRLISKWKGAEREAHGQHKTIEALRTAIERALAIMPGDGRDLADAYRDRSIILREALAQCTDEAPDGPGAVTGRE